MKSGHNTKWIKISESGHNTKWIKISELERLSGVSRRTIHFYLQKKLLPPPVKTGQTMSYYNETHVVILKRIQEYKKKGLPLIAIQEKIQPLYNQLPPTDHLEKSPKTKPKKVRSSKTRDNIIELACNLFREKGYKETKVSDITSELNIGKGSFYFYFSDKKELLFECVPIIFQSFFSEGWEKIRKEKNLIKRFELRAQIVIPVLDEFCAILQICKEAMDDPDPKIQQLGKKTYLSIRTPLERDIRKGIQTGGIKPIDPVILSSFMIGMIESIHYLKIVDHRLPSAAWESVLTIITQLLDTKNKVLVSKRT